MKVEFVNALLVTLKEPPDNHADLDELTSAICRFRGVDHCVPVVPPLDVIADEVEVFVQQLAKIQCVRWAAEQCPERFAPFGQTYWCHSCQARAVLSRRRRNKDTKPPHE